MVGTREHVGLGRLLTGSVSHYCLSHAGCPVVAVPSPPSDGRAEDSEAAQPDRPSDSIKKWQVRFKPRRE